MFIILERISNATKYQTRVLTTKTRLAIVFLAENPRKEGRLYGITRSFRHIKVSVHINIKNLENGFCIHAISGSGNS
jgi:hypothetical protein